MTMVRKQVFITAEQNRLLKQRAKAARKPQAELIRDAIDRELGIDSGKDDWKAGMMGAFGAVADEDGLEERIATLRQGTRTRLESNARKLKGAT
jgi:hypothetical protein